MEKQYVLTERAHYMCPNMHFGILFRLDAQYQPQKARDALDAVSAAHPFCRSLIARDAGRLYYEPQERCIAPLLQVSGEAALWNSFRELSQRAWDVFSQPLFKVFVCPEESGVSFLFAAHHLLADGRGLWELARQFAAAYMRGETPEFAQERLIKSLDDLPSGSALPAVSRFLVRSANRRWRREGHSVSYEQFSRFTEDYASSHPVGYKTSVTGAAELAELAARCRQQGVSVNDYLMAEMYQKTGTDKIIIAFDIRNRLSCYVPGAMGNYSTALGIVIKRRPDDVMELARQVRLCIKRQTARVCDLMQVLSCYLELDPQLLDAAAISALGGFDSSAGRFVGGGMFGMNAPRSYSITNLGRFDCPDVVEATFIPPASPAALKTVGVLTVNGVMHACESSSVG